MCSQKAIVKSLIQFSMFLVFLVKHPSYTMEWFKQDFCSSACGHREKMAGDYSKLFIQLIWGRTLILLVIVYLM